jgi:hypothetical protein
MTPAASSEETFGEFLRAEYAHIADSMLQNEEDGEKRVSTFVTLATAVGAGLGFILGSTGLAADTRHPIVAAALVALLALGYVTFMRVITRNVGTDVYKLRLNRIRQYFVTGPEDDRLRFLPFDPFRHDRRTPLPLIAFAGGGWLETVTLVNALLAGALVAHLAALGRWRWNAAVGLVAAIAARAALIAYANHKHRLELKKRSAGLEMNATKGAKTSGE